MSISLLASSLVPDDNLTCTVQFQQETINGWSVDLRQRCQTCGSEHQIQASRMRSETCHRKRWHHWDRDATPHRLLGQLNSTQTHNHTYSHRYTQTDRQTHYTGNHDVIETGMPLHTDNWISWTLHRHTITHTVTDTHRQTDRHTTQETMTSLRPGRHSTQTTGSAELYTDTQSHIQSQIHTDRQICIQSQCEVNLQQLWRRDRCFAAAGPKLWNSLLTELRQADISCQWLKQLLETVLFGCWDHGALWLTVKAATHKFSYLLTYNASWMEW